MCRAGYAATALVGEGARLYGGRWNSKGVRLVYAASTLALGAIESLVHFSSALLPADFVSIAVEIPAALAVETWTVADLPKGWEQTPAPNVLQEMGEAWRTSGRTAILRVPSAVISNEFNVLFNPFHAYEKHIHARAPEPFFLDLRLMKAKPKAFPKRKKGQAKRKP